MAATHFSNNYMTFFKNLAKNNNTAWFNENRKTYESDVKKPFADFVEHILKQVGKVDENIKITAADAIMRINKDIRFSKDKSPYKLYMSAIISPAGKKDKSYPGMYFEVSPEDVKIYGGAYEVEKSTLEKIRASIIKNHKDFKKVYSDKTFKESYGEILGDKNKKLTPDQKAFESTEPLVANKQFFYMATIDAKEALKPDFDKVLLKYFKAGKKVNDFLIASMK